MDAQPPSIRRQLPSHDDTKRHKLCFHRVMTPNARAHGEAFVVRSAYLRYVRVDLLHFGEPNRCRVPHGTVDPGTQPPNALASRAAEQHDGHHNRGRNAEHTVCTTRGVVREGQGGGEGVERVVKGAEQPSASTHTWYMLPFEIRMYVLLRETGTLFPRAPRVTLYTCLHSAHERPTSAR